MDDGGGGQGHQAQEQGPPQIEPPQEPSHQDGADGKTEIAAGREKGHPQPALRAGGIRGGHGGHRVKGRGAQTGEREHRGQGSVTRSQPHEAHEHTRPHDSCRDEPLGVPAIRDPPKDRLDHRRGDGQKGDGQSDLGVAQIELFLEQRQEHRENVLGCIHHGVPEDHESDREFSHLTTRGSGDPR